MKTSRIEIPVCISTLVERHRVLKDTLVEGFPFNNQWFSRKGVAPAIAIVRTEGVDTMKGGIDRPGRTARYVGREYRAIIISCRSWPYRHRRFCNIRNPHCGVVPRPLLFVSLFLPPRPPLLPRVLSSSPFRPLCPHTLKQNEGDAWRALKDNNYEA